MMMDSFLEMINHAWGVYAYKFTPTNWYPSQSASHGDCKGGLLFLPHPHGQIYATNFVFKLIETEDHVSQVYVQEHQRPLFQEILSAEFQDQRSPLFYA